MNILRYRYLPLSTLVSIVVVLPGSLAARAAEGNTLDERLHGTGQTVQYAINGKDHEMKELMVITPTYFIGNRIFTLENQTAPSANANAGPYFLKDGKIVITQWMQLHWRPNDEKENSLTQGVVEEIPYRFEDRMLVFSFPSGNRYVSRHLEC